MRLTKDRSTDLAYLDQAMVSGASFLATVLLVHGLGLEGFGAFSAVWLILLFVLELQSSLVSMPLLSIGPQQGGRPGSPYYASVLWIQLAFSAAVWTLTAAGLAVALLVWRDDGIGRELSGTVLAAASLVTLRQLQTFFRNHHFAKGRRKAVLVNDAVAYLGLVGLLAWHVRAEALTVHSALWCVAGSAGAACVLAVLTYGPRRCRPRDVRRTFRRHWQSGRWLTARALSQWFASNSFAVALGAVGGFGALGTLRAAQTVLGVLHVHLLAMQNLLPVRAARILSTRGLPAMRSYLRGFLARGVAFTAAVTVAVALLAPHLLRLFYGAANVEHVRALRSLSVIFVFAFAVQVLQIGFRTIERTRPLFLVQAFTAVLGVLAAKPVVTAWGLPGAALGMASQQALAAALLAWAWSREGPRTAAEPAPDPALDRAA